MIEGRSTDIAICTCFKVFSRLLLSEFKTVEIVIVTIYVSCWNKILQMSSSMRV